MLHCPFCGAEFIHSEIAKDLAHSLLCFPRKADFPSEGLALQCSNYRMASVFQRDQLTYSPT